MNGIAKAGEGKAEIILGGENIENKVMSQLKRALQPALTNVCMEKQSGMEREREGEGER